MRRLREIGVDPIRRTKPKLEHWVEISRYINVDLIKLEMEAKFVAPEEEEDNDDAVTEKQLLQQKEIILEECVRLLDNSGKISNPSKLLTDLFNREKKASTALGKGIAIPHVRTMQAKEFVIGFARSEEGYDFGAPDDEKVHLFVPMAAPPYDDSLYLKVFKTLAELFSYRQLYEQIMAAEQPYDVVRAIREIE